MKAPIYVTTSDPYIWALRPYAYLLNKYWSPNPQVIVGGFTPPPFRLPPNFHFHSIGKFEDYPIEKWSDALIKMMSELPHEVFVLMLEDYWITRPVDDGAVSMLVDYMDQFRYVVRMDLTRDRELSGSATFYGKCGHLDLVISNPDSQYHMSLMTALWRKEHLLRVLVPGETPWDIEIGGTPRLRLFKDEIIVLGTKNEPVRHTLAFRGGDNSKLLLDAINPHDVEEMDRYGLLDNLR